MITLPVYNIEGKEVDSMKLDVVVFNNTINTNVLYQAICAYKANQRKGTASTKTRSEVSAGGRKPWRQKGTGRARVGSIRSPLWRHGGVVFGPQPRNFSYPLPKKLKALALKSCLCAKIKENNFIMLDNLKIEKPKTKEITKILSKLKVTPLRRVLLLLDKIDNNLKLALRNIEFLTFNLAKNTNAYEILAHQKLIITKNGFCELINRLKK